MTGSELVDLVRREWPNLPVLMATGYAELPLGATDVPRLHKPFQQDRLARAVADAAAGRQTDLNVLRPIGGSH